MNDDFETAPHEREGWFLGRADDAGRMARDFARIAKLTGRLTAEVERLTRERDEQGRLKAELAERVGQLEPALAAANAAREELEARIAEYKRANIMLAQAVDRQQTAIDMLNARLAVAEKALRDILDDADDGGKFNAENVAIGVATIRAARAALTPKTKP